MEVHYFFLGCVLLTTAASCSSQGDVSVDSSDILALDVQGQNCNCENGRCVTDNQGHSKCVCKPGFALQDEFTCKPCDCGPLGNCIFILSVAEENKFQYEKKCVCDVGKAEKDGECVECFCGDNSACDFDFGEKRCYCIDGYSEKDGVCTECDCGFNGNCEYQNGLKMCECDEGYLEYDGICEECDCGDNGTCSFENSDKTCKCEPGFSVDNAICEPCDCGSNSIKCTLVDGVKQCECKDKYADRYGTCEECYCGDYAKSCNFNENQKTCSCLEGYVQKGETCELGCSDQHPCQNGGYCKEGFCFCLNGTRGEFCEEIDECSSLCPNEKDIACDYDTSSQKAYCKCLDDNLRYNPNLKQCRRTCEDDKSCKNQGKCTSTPRDKFCDCLEGTTGDFCEEVPVCKGVDCGSDAYCVFNPSTKSADCACKDSGLNYDATKRKCRRTCENDKSCKNQGKCTGDKFCDCLEGTTGDFCEEIPACQGVDCGSDAYCVFNPSTKRAECACKDSGLQYDATKRKCRRTCEDDKSCKNRGKCTGDKFCDCPEGTSGDFCEQVPACKGVDCGSDAYCVINPSTKRAECTCKDSGLQYDATKRKCRKFCEKDKECSNGGKCSGKGSNRFCDCLPGTNGDRCEIIDDCVSGRIKCKGLGTFCDYDVKNKRATCQCKDKHHDYDSVSGKCRRSCDKDKECDNGAKCRHHFCDCLRGTQGDRCEIIDDCASGRIRCRDRRAYCDFDVKHLSAVCKCKDKGNEYDYRNGRCRHGHHHHRSSEESSDDSSEEWR